MSTSHATYMNARREELGVGDERAERAAPVVLAREVRRNLRPEGANCAISGLDEPPPPGRLDVAQDEVPGGMDPAPVHVAVGQVHPVESSQVVMRQC